MAIKTVTNCVVADAPYTYNALDVAPKVDYDTGETKTRDGIPGWVITCVRSEGEERLFLEVTVYQREMPPLGSIAFKNLTMNFLAPRNGGWSGVYFMADEAVNPRPARSQE